MKERFLELVDQLPEIEKLFQTRYYAFDGWTPVDTIYDKPMFKIWLQEVRLEVQTIIDLTENEYAKDTMKLLSREFKGWHDRSMFNDVKGRLLAMARHVDDYYSKADNDDTTQKPIKVFISHASKDKVQVAKIVELLDDMGLDSNQIFCSSLPGYGIYNDEVILDKLSEQFQQFRLHVVIVHSHNYYASPVCLNEMGAAWILRTKCTSILLPGFDFSDMKGVVDSKTISIKLDNDIDEIKDRLNQLYETIINEFGLTRKSPIIWEQKRDAFIQAINALPVTNTSIIDENDIDKNERGLLYKKSEKEAGKNIVYCPTCYTKYHDLYMITHGSMRRDLFCTNCKAKF